VLPSFLLGLAVSRVFQKHPQLQSVLGVAFLSPFFFLKAA
jgi:Kef-type K+ transport system membrane component KefB